MRLQTLPPEYLSVFDGAEPARRALRGAALGVLSSFITDGYRDIPKSHRLWLLLQAFRPATPTDDPERLAGRAAQWLELATAISMPGCQVTVHGERGVGKTSLARSVGAALEARGDPPLQVTAVNCSGGDDFASLWARIFGRLGRAVADIAPESVRGEIERVHPPALVLIDELGRLRDDRDLALLGDTIKTFADHGVRSTIVTVGTSASIDRLEANGSMGGNTRVAVPPMGNDELRAILSRGCADAAITIAPPAADRILTFSGGLPHYTHLLGLKAAERTVQEDRQLVSLGDVKATLTAAIRGHAMAAPYARAVRSSEGASCFRELLLACAIAARDDLGCFSPDGVREALGTVLGRELAAPAFARQMKELAEPERGALLQRWSSERRRLYRFADPAARPYVIIRSLSLGLITAAELEPWLRGAPASVPRH